MTTVSAVHKFMYPWKCEFSKFRNIAVLLTNYWKHNINCPTCTVSEWGKNQLSSNLYIESLALSDIHVSTAIQYVIASMKILIGILIVKHLYIISNPEPHPTSTCFWVRSLYLSALLCSVWFSMLCRLREIQCSMSDKLFAVDFLLASLCYQTSRWNSLCNNGNKRKVRWMSPDLANERSI